MVQEQSNRTERNNKTSNRKKEHSQIGSPPMRYAGIQTRGMRTLQTERDIQEKKRERTNGSWRHMKARGNEVMFDVWRR